LQGYNHPKEEIVHAGSNLHVVEEMRRGREKAKRKQESNGGERFVTHIWWYK
jgi:hypothetical protein